MASTSKTDDSSSATGGVISRIRRFLSSIEVRNDDFGPDPSAAKPKQKPEPDPPKDDPPDNRTIFAKARDFFVLWICRIRDFFAFWLRRDVLGTIGTTAFRYNAPAIGSLLLGIGLAIPEQTREIYVKLAETIVLEEVKLLTIEQRVHGPVDISAWFERYTLIASLIWQFIFVLIAGVFIWFCCRLIRWWWSTQTPMKQDLAELEDWMARWTPRVLGFLPTGGLFAGLTLTWASYKDTIIAGRLQELTLAAAILAGGYLTIIYLVNRSRAFVAKRRAALHGEDKQTPKARESGRETPTFESDWLFQLMTTVLVFGSVVGVAFGVLVFGFWSPAHAETMGPILILCFFGYVATMVLTSLYLAGQRTGYPITSGIIVLVILQSWIGLTDNDRLSTSAAVERGELGTSPGDVYQSWQEVQPGERPIIIAAQGGGLYAAYHAAMVLARFYDDDPSFGERVIAVSGVSGGSVGAAVFDIIHRSGICIPKDGTPKIEGCYANAVRTVLRRDFLSPVLGSMLFPDFAARIVPNVGGFTDSLSRALRLEAAFKDALRDLLLQSSQLSEAEITALLESPIMAPFTPEGRPLLLLNVADVNAGDRMVITPLARFLDRLPRTFQEVTRCHEREDCFSPTIISAGVASARFPYVTPAAEVSILERDPDTDDLVEARARYADGGYFENSGVETARDFIRDVRDSHPDNREVEFDLIAMTFPDRRDFVQNRSNGFDELLAPVRTLASARQARGELAKRRARNEEENGFTYSVLRLDDTVRGFTLGWTLSELTFDRIECNLEIGDSCSRLTPDIDPGLTTVAGGRQETITDWNICTIETIRHRREPGRISAFCRRLLRDDTY
ncbi:MAG: hypothetical protein AAGE61_09650 [Pseudomonadota bacterium]